MRWKLLLAASLLATLVGAGLSLAVAWWLSGLYGVSIASPTYSTLTVFIFPLAAITTASIFVYRHTSRRRPLQAFLTALLALLLTLAALVAASMYIARRTHSTILNSMPDKFIGERKK